MQRVNKRNNEIIKIIKYVFWGTPVDEIDDAVFEQAKEHSLLALPADILPMLSVSLVIKDKWKKYIVQHMTHYVQYKYAESRLPVSVPYTILKGTSAAQYYPHPELRSMGDIDIITRKEDFDRAYQELLAGGYQVISTDEREITFAKDSIVVELHRFFSSLSDIDSAKYLDDLIIENINPSHVLEDPINGLVLLEHISQHLENGLGLRQIIDWMLFVNQCLPDEKWQEFDDMASRIRLDKLAIVVTRMCELYLGLPGRQWSGKANEALCNQLMDYILSCGNFGSMRTENSAIIEKIFILARNPIAAFKLLQERGMVNWKAVKKYRFLRPFAWAFQLGRYIIRGSNQEEATEKILRGYSESRKKVALFKELEVRQYAKGRVIYHNGKYVKK